MATDVASDFAATRRMANMDHLLEFELLHKLRQIIRISVHVIAVARLAGATMASSVMCYAAISARGQEEHLILEGVGTERPAVAEHHWLPVTPIIVVNLRAVLGLDGAHDHSSPGNDQVMKIGWKDPDAPPKKDT